MDFYTRLGMYFFTLGSLLAILAGTLPLTGEMYDLVLVLLIFFGVFSAILNVTDDEETPFLVASASFLIALVTLKILMGDHHLIIGLTSFFEAVTFFLGSMVIVVALRSALEYASQGIPKDPIARAAMASEQMERFLFTKKDHMWNFIVFVAVAVSFIVVLLDVFFTLSSFLFWFIILDVIITLIFFADLIVLYRKEESLYHFLKNCWLDVVATIPFFWIFQGLAFLRIAKMVRLVRIIRFIKLNKTLKFMSDKSGVKHYLHADALSDVHSSLHSIKRAKPRKTATKSSKK